MAKLLALPNWWNIVGDQHLVTSFGANTIKPYFAMMDELINAGLKARAPFTVDPRPTEYTSVTSTRWSSL